MTTLYGIPNCDTVKKARKWLEANGVDYTFHDFRGDGIDGEKISAWIGALGWETVINRRSTSWKELSPEERENMDAAGAVPAALARPTLIKRPVIEHDGGIWVGFAPADYEAIFG
ncbi:MAG: ArsC family reductase [Nitratireductor sp.]|nr:ArsC family reductase [Nitratireductor sp.]MCC0021109.1 ArsC family reductase [Nitratireductor sp.]